jgi:hypothetical protein
MVAPYGTLPRQRLFIYQEAKFRLWLSRVGVIRAFHVPTYVTAHHQIRTKGRARRTDTLSGQTRVNIYSFSHFRPKERHCAALLVVDREDQWGCARTWIRQQEEEVETCCDESDQMTGISVPRATVALG